MNLCKVPDFMRWCYRRVLEEYRRDNKFIEFKRSNPALVMRGGVVIRSIERLKVGKAVILDSGCFLHCGGMGWSEGRGSIVLGNSVYIGPYSVLFGAGEIEIGNDVLISPGVIIVSHQHSYDVPSTIMRCQPTQFNKVVIEDNVWIGANAVILPGVSVGRGSVIGAGAVVKGEVPPFTLFAGVPARLIKEIEQGRDGGC